MCIASAPADQSLCSISSRAALAMLWPTSSLFEGKGVGHPSH